MDDSEARKWANEMAEGFGWKWPTGITRRPNWWEKLMDSVGTFGKLFTPAGVPTVKGWKKRFIGGVKTEYDAASVGDAVMDVVKKEVRNIGEDTDSILASHIDYSPQELANALEKLGYGIEEIRRVSSYLEGVE